MSAQNQQFMKFLGALFGMRQQMGIGPTSNTKAALMNLGRYKQGKMQLHLPNKKKKRRKKIRRMPLRSVKLFRQHH